MSDAKDDFARDLEDDYKQFFRSIPEVYEAVGNLVNKVGTDKSIRFKNRLRPKRAATINAVLLHVASLSPGEQVEMVRNGMLILNDLLRRPYGGEPD